MHRSFGRVSPSRVHPLATLAGGTARPSGALDPHRSEEKALARPAWASLAGLLHRDAYTLHQVPREFGGAFRGCVPGKTLVDP